VIIYFLYRFSFYERKRTIFRFTIATATAMTKYSSSLLQCANCDEPISERVRTGLCRNCYKIKSESERRQNKRELPQFDDTPEDSTDIPIFRKPNFNLATNHQSIASTSAQQPLCTYEDGVVEACSLHHESQNYRKLINSVFQTHNMEPFEIYIDKSQTFAMANSDSVSNLMSANFSQVKFIPCHSAIRKQDKDDKRVNFIDINDNGKIQRALVRSPFYNSVKHFEFKVPNEDVIQLLNGDWRINPCYRFASSKILTGCLLVEDSKLLYVNCVEPYSKLPTLDAHFERFSMEPFPPPNVNLWVKKVTTDNAHKLLICSHVADFLVVSSMRLDQDLGCELGPTTNNLNPTANCRILIAAESIMEALRILEKNLQQCQQQGDILAQLRQVRSKFDAPSTYLPCRSFSSLTNNVTTRPYTIWTLADCDDNLARTNDIKLASQTLQIVATAVLSREDHCLKKSDFANIQRACKSKNALTTTTVIQKILDMFRDKETMNVLFNRELDRQLRDLSNVASSALSKANQGTKRFVEAVFY
jgi:hypothetical protein